MRVMGWSVLLLCLCSLLPCRGWGATTPGLTGTWQGTLTVPGGALRVVFRIAHGDHGSFIGKMDSPDQGVSNIPISEITVTAENVRMVVEANLGVFTGRLSADGKSMTGTWEQGQVAIPLTLTRINPVATPSPISRRPQTPKSPFPYLVEQVSYTNPEVTGVTLAGTLTLPRGKGPFPVVLLITGSGPEDRDETVFDHKPFLVIADYLTRRGIAVLRVDDRGVGKSIGEFGKATTLDFASDALAGVRFLKTRKEIDPRMIGLIGHSEGGMIAPMVAAKSSDVAFVVLLAAPGMPGDQLLPLQAELISRTSGISEEMIAWNRNTMEQLYAIVKRQTDRASEAQAMRDVLVTQLAKMPEQARKTIGDQESFIRSLIATLQTPWMHFFLTYDPVPTLAQVRCPVFALNGEHDLQVPYHENLAGILFGLSLAAKHSPTCNYTVRSLPGLNHLFQHSSTGSPTEYATIEETFSPAALHMIGDWIAAVQQR